MLQGRYIPVFLEKWDAVTFPLYLLCRECSNKLNPLGHLSNIGIVVIYPDISFVDNRDRDEINPILLKFPDTEDVPALSGSAGKYHHGCALGNSFALYSSRHGTYIFLHLLCNTVDGRWDNTRQRFKQMSSPASYCVLLT